jgi:hypothetical protein
MLFHRQHRSEPTFEDRIRQAVANGFAPERLPSGSVRFHRGACAVLVGRAANGDPQIETAGILVDGELAELVDRGYQKFFETPTGRRLPALAGQLKALHAFEEDLRKALGVESWYNESLGTVNQSHRYDRLLGREASSVRP